MIGELISYIGSAFAAGFGFASEIFSKIGLNYVFFVIGLVCLSVLLRLFARVFVGERIVAGAESIKENQAERVQKRRELREQKKRIKNNPKIIKFQKRR